MSKKELKRRDFIKDSVAGLAGISAFGFGPFIKINGAKKAKIAVVRTEDRKEGIHQALKLLDIPSVKGKSAFLKPNFNTADPPPGSTHNDTLAQMVFEMKDRGAAEVEVGDRSGPPDTKDVMEEKGIFQMAEDLDFKVINFEDLESKDWISFNPPGNHWNEGFSIARPAVDSEFFVSICCLKTHQYGGVFTMSLKLAVGLTPKTLMRQLHRSPDMRKMIAEISLGYKPRLIVLDGIEAFVDGGPMEGEKKTANVILAGSDLVAIDSTGLAILKDLGSNDAIMGRKIFEQEQIHRAAELGLGINASDQIEFLTSDGDSKKYAERLTAILAQG
jgi:uncharacterized protein (DUF362 family)